MHQQNHQTYFIKSTNKVCDGNFFKIYIGTYYVMAFFQQIFFLKKKEQAKLILEKIV